MQCVKHSANPFWQLCWHSGQRFKGAMERAVHILPEKQLEHQQPLTLPPCLTRLHISPDLIIIALQLSEQVLTSCSCDRLTYDNFLVLGIARDGTSEPKLQRAC